MTKKELQGKLEQLKKEYEMGKNKAYEEYAFSSNPHKLGDVITDHTGSIKIEKIRWAKTLCSSFSECVYFGKSLKKDGTPKKKNETVAIYQSNIITKGKA